MTNSKLIQILRSFSREEFREFGKFVSSPFFYQDKAVIRLYGALKEFYPDFAGKGLAKELIFRKIYPNRPYSDSLMKYLMSGMFSLSKKFLAYINYDRSFLESQKRLMIELQTRNLGSIFENSLKRLNKTIDAYTVRDEEHFFQMYILQRTVDAFYSYKDRLSLKRNHTSKIQNLLNSFLISMLRLYNIILSDKNEYNLDFELNLIDDIRTLIDKNSALIDPVAAIHYNMFMLAYKNDLSYYSALTQLKNEYLHRLDRNDKHLIFEKLDNFCVARISAGETAYYRELFNLGSDEMKNGVRYDSKIFSDIFFMNKVEVAAKLKEYGWAYSFIENYGERLNQEHKDDIINFCYAIIEFEKKDFSSSLRFLSKINLNHPLLKFRLRNYMLLTYYELNYIEPAYSLLDTYRHMLKKDKKVESKRKQRYSVFLNLYQNLLDIKSGNRQIEKERVAEDIARKSIYMKQWLMEKAGEL